MRVPLISKVQALDIPIIKSWQEYCDRRLRQRIVQNAPGHDLNRDVDG